MQRIALSKDLELSQIIYGMWRLGDDHDTSPAAVQAKIEACLEQGITPWIKPTFMAIMVLKAYLENVFLLLHT
jgi:hypothetical protein